MIRLSIALIAAATLGGCATRCERDTPNFRQPNPYGGIATAQDGCEGVRRPVRSAELQERARS